ncbi:uncharacterized protein LOC110040659 [Orbicella faveolata]|uniref:uncharacterized protein LOC110040659 n=1 Tax=Orbicella faveolata TaxID=48498 RepID=UPI0009E37961|nr:uncharacterized protein LOC110040659 [Orbicella faveolata]
MNSLTAQLWLALFSFFVVNVTSSGNICRESCDVEFVKIGCFNDKRNIKRRALPNYIYQERDRRLTKNYGGRRIEWNNWNMYYPGFACRCAQKAKELGYDIFGLQFYGECWAGHSNLHNYARYGSAKSGCIQDDYLPCQKNSRYCMGGRYRNMVYQIVDTSCPQVPFEKVGCFNDFHITSARPLPDYLFNDRDDSIDNYSGRRVDWVNWDVYVPQFACRCAAAAKAKNHTFFGMQFYGECWSGGDSNVLYDRDGVSKRLCVDKCYQPCTEQSNFCSGKNFANYVYRIKDGSCEINFTPVGCYKEDGSDLAMQEIFHNEVSPELPNFDGNVLPDSSDDYIAAFPDFLCKCARKAAENEWGYFGVRELGLCVRSNPTITNYNKYGSSDQCFEGNDGKMCASGSMLCGGNQTAANYVYKITLPGVVVPSSDMAQEDQDEFFNPRFF